MDDRLIDGRGGTMAFSLEGMEAQKRKPRSGKRPESPALAQAVITVTVNCCYNVGLDLKLASRIRSRSCH